MDREKRAKESCRVQKEVNEKVFKRIVKFQIRSYTCNVCVTINRIFIQKIK